MSYDCQDCGACCMAPMVQISKGLAVPGPCSALEGEIGREVSCGIYPDRPKACRDFEAGSMECKLTRLRMGISD